MSVADSVRTAVWASADESVPPVTHAGVWSLASVMVTVIVCAVEGVLPASVAASTTTQVSELSLAPQAGDS